MNDINNIDLVDVFVQSGVDLETFIIDCFSYYKENHKRIITTPVRDGNGRSIRCFTNKLLENGGLPPIYIKKDEKER